MSEVWKSPVTRLLNFRYEVPASTAVLLANVSPLSGFITHITFHFPDGCNALVWVRALIEKKPIYPVDEMYVALDDCTPTYQFLPRGQPIIKDQAIEVEIRNYDTDYPHQITVLFSLKGWLKIMTEAEILAHEGR